MVVSVRKYISLDDDSWFSNRYIEQKGKLYKCRVCSDQRWRNRMAMAQHQRVGAMHNRFVRAAKHKKKEVVLEANEECEQSPKCIPEEHADDLPQWSTRSSHGAEERSVAIEDNFEQDFASPMLGGAHTKHLNELEPPRQHISSIKIETCVYAAKRTNGYYLCIWCGTPETPPRRYRRCKRWRQEIIEGQSDSADPEEMTV